MFEHGATNMPPEALSLHSKAGLKLSRKGSTVKAIISDMRTRDEVRLRGGTALRRSVPSNNALAHWTARTPSQATQWHRHGEGVVGDFFELLFALASRTKGRPEALIAEASIVMDVAVRDWSDRDLVEAFWRSMQDESEADGAEDTASQMLARTGDLEELEKRDMAAASAALYRARITRELRRRGISPIGAR